MHLRQCMHIENDYPGVQDALNEAVDRMRELIKPPKTYSGQLANLGAIVSFLFVAVAFLR